MDLLDFALRVLVALFGIALALSAGLSAIRTFVLPRSSRDLITHFVFKTIHGLLHLVTKRSSSYEWRDRVLAMYAPLALLLLPAIWITLITIGYACIYWAGGVRPAYEAFTLSGSALLTLGFARSEGFGIMAITFSEAMVGLMQIALIISYLPTMYSAFSDREEKVSLLTVRAGSPPTAVEMLLRFHRIHGLEQLNGFWSEWEVWFAHIEESHSSLAPLIFFRSPTPERSWLTASGAVLDAASLYASTLDLPRSPRAELCIRAGYLALRTIADYFDIPYDPQPKPDDPITVRREEYDAAYDQLVAAMLPVKADREQAWRDFAGWRVNYDHALVALAEKLQVPYAPWSSDRTLADGRFAPVPKVDLARDLG